MKWAELPTAGCVGRFPGAGSMCEGQCTPLHPNTALSRGVHAECLPWASEMELGPCDGHLVLGVRQGGRQLAVPAALKHAVQEDAASSGESIPGLPACDAARPCPAFPALAPWYLAELGQGCLREKGLLPGLHSQHFQLGPLSNTWALALCCQSHGCACIILDYGAPAQ